MYFRFGFVGSSYASFIYTINLYIFAIKLIKMQQQNVGVPAPSFKGGSAMAAAMLLINSGRGGPRDTGVGSNFPGDSQRVASYDRGTNEMVQGSVGGHLSPIRVSSQTRVSNNYKKRSPPLEQRIEVLQLVRKSQHGDSPRRVVSYQSNIDNNPNANTVALLQALEQTQKALLKQQQNANDQMLYSSVDNNALQKNSNAHPHSHFHHNSDHHFTAGLIGIQSNITANNANLVYQTTPTDPLQTFTNAPVDYLRPTQTIISQNVPAQSGVGVNQPPTVQRNRMESDNYQSLPTQKGQQSSQMENMSPIRLIGGSSIGIHNKKQTMQYSQVGSIQKFMNEIPEDAKTRGPLDVIDSPADSQKSLTDRLLNVNLFKNSEIDSAASPGRLMKNILDTEGGVSYLGRDSKSPQSRKNRPKFSSNVLNGLASNKNAPNIGPQLDELQSQPTIALVDDDVDALLGEFGKPLQPIVEKKRRISGFKLGSVVDSDLSQIEKDSADDPNQLFTNRQPLPQTQATDNSPERERSTSNGPAPDTKPTLLTVQSSLQKKPILTLNTKTVNSGNSQPRTVSFANANNNVTTALPPDSSHAIFLALIEEAEKNAQRKKDALALEGKKLGFGYYSRVLTHFSISYGVSKLRQQARGGSNPPLTEYQGMSQLLSPRGSPVSNKSGAPQYHANGGLISSRRGSNANLQVSRNVQQTSSVVGGNKAFNFMNIPATTGETGFNSSQQLNTGFVNLGPKSSIALYNKTLTHDSREHRKGDDKNQMNLSQISMNTDNTAQNMKDEFPLPPMIFTGRSQLPETLKQLTSGGIQQQSKDNQKESNSLLSSIKSIANKGNSDAAKPPKPASMTNQPPLIKPLNPLGGSMKMQGQQQQYYGEPSKKITFPNVKDLNLKDLSSLVYLKIKTAPPFSCIYLPERHIVLPGLTILHPLTIIGTPSTTLEIVNGNILIDFRNFKAQNNGVGIYQGTNTLAPNQQQNPEIQPDPMRVIIQEVTLSFKMNTQRLRERLEEYNEKIKSIKQEKHEPKEWNENKLLGGELSMRASYEQDGQVPYSMRGLRYVQASRNSITLPLIIVENDSVLELRDGLLRSSRNDSSNSNADQSKQYDDKSDWTARDRSNGASFIGALGNGRDSLQPNNKRESIGSSEIEDICLWINGDCISEQCSKSPYQDLTSNILATSCIFHNFNTVVRAGVNATVALQKCVLKDSRANALHLVNPKAFLLDRCSIQAPKKTGVQIEWLRGSDQLDMGRNIIMTGNEVKACGRDGILIQSYLQFSAHNLKILLQDNIVSKCQGEGITIKNLAIASLDIIRNETSRNQQNGIYLSQVHQKSNKFKFTMRECVCNEQLSGYGCYLFDTGILIEDCEFRLNEQGGMHVLVSPLKSNDRAIPEEIRFFLERFPMIVQINRCDFNQNTRSGLVVEDFWKGPVLIQDSKFQSNKHSGVILSAQSHPPEHSLFRSNKTNDASSFLLATLPRRLANSQTTSNVSMAKVVPSNLFADDNPTSKKPQSTYQNPLKHLAIGCIYLQQCQITDNKTHGLSISNVGTDCNNCVFAGNLAHAINLADEDHHQLLRMRFNNYKQQLQGTVGGTWGVMQLQFKSSGCAGCFSLCGLGSIGQTNAVFTKKNDNKHSSLLGDNTPKAMVGNGQNSNKYGSPRNQRSFQKGGQVITIGGGTLLGGMDNNNNRGTRNNNIGHARTGSLRV